MGNITRFTAGYAEATTISHLPQSSAEAHGFQWENFQIVFRLADEGV
jgi:hypothetical protein